jgi:hypothetical protein
MIITLGVIIQLGENDNMAGRNVSRVEALRIARQTLEDAERERDDLVFAEALEGDLMRERAYQQRERALPMGWPRTWRRWRVGRYSVWVAWMYRPSWDVWYDTTNGQGDVRIDAGWLRLAVMW